MSKQFEERWDKIGKDLEKLGDKAKSAIGDAQAARELGQEVLESKIKDAKGDIVALQENARIIGDEQKSRLFSQMLKAQMTVKAKFEDLKKAHDRNMLEGYIDAHLVHLADLYDTIRSACTASDGKVYEYPLCMVAHCMAINRNMFEKADALQYLDEENHTWNSTEDFLKAVQAVYDSGQTDVAAVYCAGQGGDQGTRALVNNMYGGTFTNADHTAYTVSSDENNKALKALYDQNGINFDASLVGGDEINLFRQGVLAMSLCWNASQQNNTDNNDAGLTNDGDTILPMAFPTESGDAKLCGGIWGFGIFDNGDENKIAAAKTFIDFMCNDGTEASKAVLAAGFFPVHQNMGNVYEGTDTADTMQMFTDYFMPKMGDYYQVTPGWAEARTAWWNMLQSIGTGSDIPTETANFDTTANAALAAATS